MTSEEEYLAQKSKERIFDEILEECQVEIDWPRRRWGDCHDCKVWDAARIEAFKDMREFITNRYIEEGC